MTTNPTIDISKSMLSLILSLLISLLTSSLAYTQTIEMERTFGSLKFYQDGEALKLKKIKKLLRANEKSAKIAKDAYSLRAIGLGLRTTGIIVFVGAVRNNNQSRNNAWSFLAWGGGLILASIPLSIFSTKKIVKAVNIYNQEILTGSNYRKPLEFSVTSQGNDIGIRVSF